MSRRFEILLDGDDASGYQVSLVEPGCAARLLGLVARDESGMWLTPVGQYEHSPETAALKLAADALEARDVELLSACR